MANKNTTEEVLPMVDTASREIVDFAKQEDDAANKLFYEATGQTPPGEKSAEAKEEGAEEGVKKEEQAPMKEEAPAREEASGNKEEVSGEKAGGEEDLSKNLTVENATKRISAAQRKMHDSNKAAKEASTERERLKKENDELRALVDEKATGDTGKAGTGTVIESESEIQTEVEVDEDLENLRKEYPEIAEPMIKMMQKQQAQNGVLRDRLDKYDAVEKKRGDDEKVSKENKHYDAIADAHPDFNEISQEPLLDEWINDLDAMERAGAKAIRSGGETKDVIALLTRFKKENGYELPGETKADPKGDAKVKTDSKIDKAKKHQTPQFNKAKELNTEERPILFTQAQMHAWTAKEWDDNEDAVNEALANGQVR
jgi:hypothetical protein